MTSSFSQPSHPQSTHLSVSSLESLHGWKLEDAKARFSEVVRLARDSEPQRITVRGEDAVVILSAKTFAKVLPLLEQPSLHAMLSQSPLSLLDFEQLGTQSPVRDVEL
jgi:prevent-host-death family protein